MFAAPARTPKGANVVEAAEVGEVLHEQLETLIRHTEERTCGCPDCIRYMRVRLLLLTPFAEPGMLTSRGKNG